MFVSTHKRITRFNRQGEQVARGYYMLWVQAAHFDYAGNYITGPMYAAVRYVSLTQNGHWLDGTFRIGGKVIRVSGSLGSDGLPVNFKTSPADAPAVGIHPGFSDSWLSKWFVKVPANVIQVWGESEGHSTCHVPAVRGYGRELYHATYVVDPRKGPRFVKPSAKTAQEWATRQVKK